MPFYLYKKACLLLFIISTIACNNKNKLYEKKGSEETEFVSNDTIPEIRKTVKKRPVASYLVSTSDRFIESKFGVEVFETGKTFEYLLKMQYGGVKVTDTLKLPNFGIWPVVEVKPSKEKLTCVVGFLDKQKNFKEYKMLTAKGDKLKLKVLHHYFAGSYRTEY